MRCVGLSLTCVVSSAYNSRVYAMNWGPRPTLWSTSHKYCHARVSNAFSRSSTRHAACGNLPPTLSWIWNNRCMFWEVFLPGTNPLWSGCISLGSTCETLSARIHPSILQSAVRRVMGRYEARSKGSRVWFGEGHQHGFPHKLG